MHPTRKPLAQACSAQRSRLASGRSGRSPVPDIGPGAFVVARRGRMRNLGGRPRCPPGRTARASDRRRFLDKRIETCRVGHSRDVQGPRRCRPDALRCYRDPADDDYEVVVRRRRGVVQRAGWNTRSKRRPGKARRYSAKSESSETVCTKRVRWIARDASTGPRWSSGST